MLTVIMALIDARYSLNHEFLFIATIILDIGGLVTIYETAKLFKKVG